MYFDYAYDPSGPMMSDTDRLAEFLGDVKWFLGRLSKHKPAFIEGVYDDVVNAWKAVEHRFNKAIQQVRITANDALEAAGLTGPELKLKLRNVEHAFGELVTSRVSGTLRHFFDTINSLLKSVAEACGLGTALEEIKDAIRDALAWART